MSTIQVDRIIPYQSSSVQIDSLSVPNLATTGSNTFTGNQNIQGTITASIAQGFALVGGVGNVSTLVATSSFGGALPSGVVSGSSQITELGFATTGSNTFVGNQTITGSVTISGSATNDLVIEGRALISTPTSGQTPQLQVSSSLGRSTLSRGGIAAVDSIGTNLELSTATDGAAYLALWNATGTEIGFNLSPSSSGYVTGWSGGPSIYVNDGPSNFPAAIGFQSAANYTDGTVTILKPLDVSGSLDIQSTLTASLQQGYVWVGDVNGRTATVSTGSFGGGGGGATLGANTFTGDQTLIDASGNTITLSDASGSLLLVAKTFTSASAHLTGSAGNQVNIIFKNNDNTTDTIISGSNNIFTNPSAPTAEFRRIIGSNNIVNSATGIPQVTGSMTTPITMASNYFGSGTTTVRGPITGSGYTISNNAIFGTLNLGQAGLNDLTRTPNFSFTGNQVIGTMTFAASTNAALPTLASTPSITNNIVNGAMQGTMNSSSLAFQNNIVNAGSFIIANNHFTTAAGTGQLTVNNNIVGGLQFTNLTVQGANPAGTTNNPAFSGNLSYGISNAAHINADLARTSGTNAYTALNATAILGGNLAVTGSSLGSDTTSFGSAFVGRFNANDGIRNKTSDVVFAVGTGTATGTRKTGFLIDSGSNTFVEGTLNVSGSSVFTGSLILSSSAATELQVIGNTEFSGSVKVAPTFQLQLPTGSNQQAGTAVLDGANPGAVVVSNSLVTANSIIMVSKQTLAHPNGYVAVSSKGAGTFTITSNHNGDTDTVGWFIINNS